MCQWQLYVANSRNLFTKTQAERELTAMLWGDSNIKGGSRCRSEKEQECAKLFNFVSGSYLIVLSKCPDRDELASAILSCS